MLSTCARDLHGLQPDFDSINQELLGVTPCILHHAIVTIQHARIASSLGF